MTYRLVRVSGKVNIVRQGFDQAAFNSVMTIVIDDGVAQNAIEPRSGGLFAAQSVSFIERAGVSGLKKLFGKSIIRDSFSYKREELVSLSGQIEDCLG